MTTYKVLSSRFALGEIGKTLDSDALDGCNIEAAIEAGHLAEVSSKFKKEIMEETEK
jgi:hypothetical protein